MVKSGRPASTRRPSRCAWRRGSSQRSGDHLQVRVLVTTRSIMRPKFVGSRPRGSRRRPRPRAQGRREILLVAEHDDRLGAPRRVDLACPGLATDRLPQRGAVIQVVADDCAVTAAARIALLGDSWGRLRERREDAARVKPARALGPKDSVQSISPARSCETAVWPRSEQPSAARTPKPRSVKFRPVAHGPSDPVVGHPTDVREVHAAFEHEVLDETAYRIVRESGHDRRSHSEDSTRGRGLRCNSPPPSRPETCGSWRSVPRPDRDEA